MTRRNPIAPCRLATQASESPKSSSSGATLPPPSLLQQCSRSPPLRCLRLSTEAAVRRDQIRFDLFGVWGFRIVSIRGFINGLWTIMQDTTRSGAIVGVRRCPFCYCAVLVAAAVCLLGLEGLGQLERRLLRKQMGQNSFTGEAAHYLASDLLLSAGQGVCVIPTMLG